ncbi:MAG TPA: hypothetical protein VEG34_19155, partial [Thermoanaerobaculia bacterium]|nr:hypothetical protein [Thermoanaerobaculia bacterium]
TFGLYFAYRNSEANHGRGFLFIAGLVFIVWFVESWATAISLRRLSRIIGEVEEMKGGKFWVDAHIRSDYFLWSRLSAMFSEAASVVEPLGWFMVFASIVIMNN